MHVRDIRRRCEDGGCSKWATHHLMSTDEIIGRYCIDHASQAIVRFQQQEHEGKPKGQADTFSDRF